MGVKTGVKDEDTAGGKLKVKAVISFSGPTDLETLSTANGHLNPYLVTYLSSIKEGSFADKCKAASPITYAYKAIPTVLIHGTEDKNVPFAQSVAMAKAMYANKVPCRHITVEGADHQIGVRSRRLALDQALKFISELEPDHRHN